MSDDNSLEEFYNIFDYDNTRFFEDRNYSGLILQKIYQECHKQNADNTGEQA